MTDVNTPSLRLPADTLFHADGDMATRMRAFDWSSTPLGPVDGWPVSLRTTVTTILGSRHAMFLWWGPDLIQFYNDSYRESLGPDRHPSALGGRGRETWAEIWPIIGHEVEGIMAGAAATWHEDHLVPITRGDRVHDVYWSYSYSPVLDDDGGVGGVLVTVQETTRRVVAERRMRVVGSVASAVHDCRTAEEVCTAAAAALEGAAEDAAYALVYLAERGGALALAAASGVEPGSPQAPHRIASVPEVWPAGSIAVDRWPEPVDGAIAVPIAATSHGSAPQGLLVVGTNPRLPVDDAHRAFVAAVAREVAAALDRVSRVEQERTAALASAQAQRELLEGVFRLSPSFVAVLSVPDLVFELANPAYLELVGGRAVHGRPLAEALPEVVAQGFADVLTEVFRSGEPFVGNELRVELPTSPDGGLRARYVNFVFQPMTDARGVVTAILVTGVDVSGLVEAREAEALARAEAERAALDRDAERRQLLTVLDQSPLAIVVAEAPSGRFLFLNSRVAEIFGTSPVSRGVLDYSAHYRGFHLDGRPIEPDEWPMSRALRGESVWNEVLEIERMPKRDRREIALTATPVRDSDGRIIAGVTMFRDVTEERRLERQLHNAQRLQAVGTLAGGVAHEINNQMTAVVGFGDFVLRALGPDHAQSPDVRLNLQAGQRAARVSQQLLAFTRQQVTQARTLALPAVVADLRPVLAQLLGSDKTLRVTADPEVLAINADPDQVQQVLINLVANARDATDTGAEIRITIENAVVEGEIAAPLGEPVAPGRYVRVGVADAGTGMSRETLARIFDPFFTTKPVGKGTGLGLPMVYGTMRRHGGYVVARSAVGIGTTVDLYWPVAAAGENRAERAATPPAIEARTSGAAGVVLVVEDDPMVRALAVRTLEEERYRVVQAADGVEGLATLEREAGAVQAVVTDVIMPRLNGRQLSDAVRERWPGIPVLFISGHTGEGQVLDRLVPPGAPFLQKPFTPDELARAVGTLVARRGA